MKKYIIPIVLVLVLIIGWSVYRGQHAEAPSDNPIVADTEDVNEPTVGTPEPGTEKPEEKKKPTSIKFVDQDVPFTSQAPTGEWSDERQQDGCEEASSYMAMLWVRGEDVPSPSEVREEIIGISDFEQKTYGEYRDIALEDIRDWIFKGYYKYSNVEVKQEITAADIIDALQQGHVVIAPMNGQLLGNPYFSGDGPERHMILIRGYDPAKKQFITNDPGTKRGEKYRYSEETIMNAIVAYPTGYHAPADPNKKGILIVKK